VCGKMESVKKIISLVTFITLASFSSQLQINVQAAETQCSLVGLTPETYVPAGTGLSTWVYSATGELPADEADAVSNRNIPVLTNGDQVTITVNPTLSFPNLNSYTNFSAEICTSGAGLFNSRNCSGQFSGNLQSNGSISFSLPIEEVSGTGLNVYAENNGNQVEFCRQNDLQNIFSVNDLTPADDNNPGGLWSSPSCDALNVSIDGNTLFANYESSGFDNFDPFQYQLVFSGENIQNQTRNSTSNQCCASNECQRNGPVAIGSPTLCEDNNLELNVNNISQAAYISGQIELRNVSNGNIICSQQVEVDQKNNEADLGDLEESDRENPPQNSSNNTSSSTEPQNTSYRICRQIEDASRRDACETCLGDDNSPAGIWTAVGCIETDFEAGIGTILGIGLSIGGGIALLRILAAAFLLTTSQGESKQIGEAKEMISSSIYGILFIIFSVAILQFIGVNILQIPGFGT